MGDPQRVRVYKVVSPSNTETDLVPKVGSPSGAFQPHAKMLVQELFRLLFQAWMELSCIRKS